MKQTISVLSDRRNPLAANQTGSEGRASEFTAPMYGHSNSHTFQLSTPCSLISKSFAAKMRSRVRYPRVDVCLNCKQDNQIESGSDCAHCQPACEAATGRPDPQYGYCADLSEGRLSTSLLTASDRIGGDGVGYPSQGKRANFG